MRLRSAARRYFGEAVDRAPYRAPPIAAHEGEAESARSGAVWALACAAALAVMVTMPLTANVGEGSRLLGARAARTIEAGVVRELGARVVHALAESPWPGQRSSKGDTP